MAVGWIDSAKWCYQNIRCWGVPTMLYQKTTVLDRKQTQIGSKLENQNLWFCRRAAEGADLSENIHFLGFKRS